jgi:hypothetical protein
MPRPCTRARKTETHRCPLRGLTRRLWSHRSLPSLASPSEFAISIARSGLRIFSKINFSKKCSRTFTSRLRKRGRSHAKRERAKSLRAAIMRLQRQDPPPILTLPPIQIKTGRPNYNQTPQSLIQASPKRDSNQREPQNKEPTRQLQPKYSGMRSTV